MSRKASSDPVLIAAVCCLVAGACSLLVSLDDSPGSLEELEHLEGRVARIEIRSGPRASRTGIVHLSTRGEVWELNSKFFDFAKEPPIAPGDEIEVWVQSDLLGRNLHWIWQMRSGGQTLLTLDEALRANASRDDRAAAFSPIPLGLGALLLAFYAYRRSRSRST